MRALAVALMLAVLGGSGVAAKAPPKPARPVVSIDRLLPPPPGQVYLGLTYRLWDSADPAYGDTRPYAVRAADTLDHELGGKPPAFVMAYAAWGDGFASVRDQLSEASSFTGPGGFAYVDWTLAETTAQNGGPTVAGIAAGRYDTYIRAFAAGLAAYKKPVLIRLFGGEFNGSWWYGQSPLANPALTPATFVAAWKHVVNLARAAGALNVSWAWIPQATPGPVSWADADIARYWPGDSYVDWAGADEYDSLAVGSLESSYNFAVAQRKPFLLAEWGVRLPGSTLTPSQQTTWLQSMFSYIHGHTDIGAAAYFDYDNASASGVTVDPSKTVVLDDGAVTYQRDTNDGDHRLLADSDQGWPALFAAQVQSPSWRSVVRQQVITVPR